MAAMKRPQWVPDRSMFSLGETWWIAMGGQSWGRGHTKREALAAMPFRVRADGCELIRMPPGAVDPWVDDMGNIRWTWEPTAKRSNKRLDREPMAPVLRELLSELLDQTASVAGQLELGKLEEKLDREYRKLDENGAM